VRPTTATDDRRLQALFIDRVRPSALTDEELNAALEAVGRRHHIRRGRAKATAYELALRKEWSRRQGVRAVEALQRAREQRRVAGKSRAHSQRLALAELLQEVERAKAAAKLSDLSDRATVIRLRASRGQPTDARAIDSTLRRLRRARERNRGQ
jgi:hypothetical protein